MTDHQRQKSGNNSQNIQAENVYIGLNYDQTRKIASDIFEANFLKLRDSAAEIAIQRSNKFTTLFLEKIFKTNPQLLDRFTDPGIQTALFAAQKEYACSGDDEILDLLSNILVDRVQEDKKTLRQIVLNESLSIAPKLTSGQICTLSFIFLLNHVGFYSVKNIDSFLEFINIFLAPLLPYIEQNFYNIQHLNYTGCMISNATWQSLAHTLLFCYPGLFCKGFNKKKLDEILPGLPGNSDLIIPCFHAKDLIQISVLNEGQLEAYLTKLGISEGSIKNIINLQKSHLMTKSEVEHYLISLKNDTLNNIFLLCAQTSILSQRLTTVGISIAIAYLKKYTGLPLDLSVFIQ